MSQNVDECLESSVPSVPSVQAGERSQLQSTQTEIPKKTLKQRDEVMEEFQEFCKSSEHDQVGEVKYLSQLADRYKKHGTRRHPWLDLVKAHSLYNSCAVRDSDRETEWTEVAHNIHRQFMNTKSAQPCPDLCDITKELKTTINEIRGRNRQGLEKVRSITEKWSTGPGYPSDCDHKTTDDFNMSVKALAIQTSEEMIDFAKEIIKKSVQMCGDPPCKFDAIAIGSLGKYEATPYSDLEYIFIVESDEHYSYFETLAVTTYFMIANLGETNLKYMNIEELKWFSDKVSNGFRIDGFQPQAGNIPTGTADKKFICTVDELYSQYRRCFLDPVDEEALKGDLTAMLSHSCLLFGDDSLHREFRKKIRSLQPRKRRKDLTAKMFANDLRQYPFTVDHTLSTTKNIKRDFYRYPSLTLFNLKISHSIDSKHSWETLDQLKDKQLVSDEVSACLLFLLNTSVYLRADCYNYYRRQCDDAVATLKNFDIASMPRLYMVDEKVLFHIALRLSQIKGRKITEPFDCLQFFTAEFRVNKDLAILYTLYYTGEIKQLASKVQNDDSLRETVKHDIDAYFMLIYSFIDLQDFSTAENELKLLSTTDASINAMRVYAEGYMWRERDDKIAEGFFMKAMRLAETNAVSVPLLLFKVHRQLGHLYLRNKKYPAAIEHFQKALKLGEGTTELQIVLGKINRGLGDAHLYSYSMRNRSLEDILSSQSGSRKTKDQEGAMYDPHQLEKAEIHLNEAFKINQEIPADDMEKWQLDHSFAYLYKAKGEEYHEKALRHFCQSLKMACQVLPKGDNHVVALLMSIADIHTLKKQYIEARRNLKQALDLVLQYGDVVHSFPMKLQAQLLLTENSILQGEIKEAKIAMVEIDKLLTRIKNSDKEQQWYGALLKVWYNIALRLQNSEGVLNKEQTELSIGFITLASKLTTSQHHK